MSAGLNDVVIAGQGLLSAYGSGVDACTEGLFAGRHAFRPAGSRFPPALAALPVGTMADLPGIDSSEPLLDRMRWMLADAPPPPSDAALYVATTAGEIGLIEQEVLSGAPPSEASRLSRLPARLAQALGLRTSTPQLVSSACASSLAALALAASAIRRGQCASALVVGGDVVSEFTLSGFAALMALDPAGARPFDARRRGITLGGAVAYALLMPRERACREGRPCLGVVGGWGLTCDANHLTGPSRDGVPLAEAVGQALRMTGCNPQAIAAIAAHGTGTVFNDQMELLAFNRVFGEPCPLFSIKGGLGHTLGAAGLAGVLVGLDALRRGRIPPTVGLEELAADAHGWASTEAVVVPSDGALLTTASGFGGINAALVLALSNLPSSLASPAAAAPAAATVVAGCGTAEVGERLPPSVGEEDRPRRCARFSAGAQRASVAVRRALAEAGRRVAPCGRGRIGIIAHDREGCAAANHAYFSDYAASGRRLGRGQLFTATLPTSVAAECAIALGLRGPLLAIAEPDGGEGAARRAAAGLLAEGLADAMILLNAAGTRAEARVLVSAGDASAAPRHRQPAKNLHLPHP